MKIEETIQLWTKMWLVDSERYNKTRNLLESMQTSSEGCVVELMECLNKLTQSMISHADDFLSASSALVTQSRNAVRAERDAVLTHLQAVQHDVEALHLNRRDLLAQVLHLQEDRRAMRLRIGEMASRADLSAAQFEAAARAADVRTLEMDAARQRDTLEGLAARLRDSEAENFGLQSQLQVRALLNKARCKRQALGVR